ASGNRDRGSPGKTPFVVASRDDRRGKLVRLKLRRVTSCCATAISGFAKRSVGRPAPPSAMAFSVSAASQGRHRTADRSLEPPTLAPWIRTRQDRTAMMRHRDQHRQRLHFRSCVDTNRNVITRLLRFAVIYI